MARIEESWVNVNWQMSFLLLLLVQQLAADPLQLDHVLKTEPASGVAFRRTTVLIGRLAEQVRLGALAQLIGPLGSLVTLPVPVCAVETLRPK